MIDTCKINSIYYCGIPSFFGGGINSFQIKVRMLFKENEVKNNLFIFVNNSRKQAKLYFEDDNGIG